MLDDVLRKTAPSLHAGPRVSPVAWHKGRYRSPGTREHTPWIASGEANPRHVGGPRIGKIDLFETVILRSLAA